MVRIIRFSDTDFGVYSKTQRGPFNTPLVFRGTLAECRAYIREN